MSSNVLRGVRVVELAEVWAGPMGCSLLADLGAAVVKVETFPRSSMTRPVAADARVGAGTGPPYERVNVHHHANRNKRNIAVDVRTPAGAEVLRRLVVGADLLVESFSAGTLERLGFGWAAVHAIEPRASLISLAAWGQDGPYRGYRMFGSGLDAMVGHHLVRGHPGAPLEETGPTVHSDAAVPLTVVFAAVAALALRDRSGEGSWVDLAQVEDLAWQLPAILAEWLANGRLPPRVANGDRDVVPHGYYPAAGGEWICVAAEDDTQWAALAEAIGRPELAREPHPWTSVVGRMRERGAVDAAVARFVSSLPAAEAAEHIQRLGAIAAPVLGPGGPLASPQLRARGWLRSIRHPHVGRREVGGFLWQLDPDPPAWDRSAALVGEHNGEVLAELGYSAAEIDELAAEGVIGDRYEEPP